MKVPERTYARSTPTPAEIAELLNALHAAGTRDSTVQLFRRLGEFPPRVRLAVNIKNFMGETIRRDVNNVLLEGLQPWERGALFDVQTSGVSVHLREVAHGLLNVHERWLVKRALSKPMLEARKCEQRIYKPGKKLLDDILGKP